MSRRECALGCWDEKGNASISARTPIPFTRENTQLIGMALKQFPTITGEGGRVSSRNRDPASNGGTMDREIEAVDRPRQILLASRKYYTCQNSGFWPFKFYLFAYTVSHNVLWRESEMVSFLQHISSNLINFNITYSKMSNSLRIYEKLKNVISW